MRNELLTALQAGKPVIPILLAPLPSMPDKGGLPDELRALSECQAYTLRDEHWEADLNELVRVLVDKYNFREAEKRVVLPQPEVTIPPLTEEELYTELKALPAWEPVESLIPGDYPKSRQELRKVFVFKSFGSAIEFMHRAVEPINKAAHHPRWENQWRTVTVYLTTWDIGLRISRLDIDLARTLDGLYSQRGNWGN